MPYTVDRLHEGPDPLPGTGTHVGTGTGVYLPTHIPPMFDALRASTRRHPLAWLTFIAAVPRLVAAFFSGGYFAQDDHFLVIEAAQSWLAQHDYNYWLPWNQPGIPQPTGHMMLYPGLHYLLFAMWEWFGLKDPDAKMVLVRLLHAAWSLVIVRAGYRIARQLGNERIAWNCGLFLALFFFMPFLSVRNLIEMVSAPLLMLSAWWLLKAAGPSKREGPVPATWLLLAGAFAGLAINIRFQTVFFSAGAGLALLLRRDLRGAALFAGGVLAPIVLIQGTIDLFIWGRPFVEMTEYVRYNLANPDNTGIESNWFNYLLLLAGVLIPPLSFAVLFGFARSTRPLVLWLPALLFLFFHSVFSNRQERFILPVLPLFFVLGYCAWERWREGSTWWQRHPRVWKGALAFTWTLNVALLVPLSVSYSKRERVEAMRLLRGQEGITGIIVEDTVEQDAPMMPLYYWGKWDGPNDPYTDRRKDLVRLVEQNPVEDRANAILFIGTEDLPTRLARATLAMGGLEFVGAARPGLLDRTLHWLNPVNRNMVILVFRKKA